MELLSAVVCFAALAVVTATNVRQCPNKNIPNLSDVVQLSPCKKVPCGLKRNSVQYITMKFTPDKDIDVLKNKVNAEVLGVPLPFVGVDGNSICDKLYTEDDVKASCPVKAGTTYKYKDSFPVESYYPPIDVDIYWALLDGNNEVMCFKVAAKIK